MDRIAEEREAGVSSVAEDLVRRAVAGEAGALQRVLIPYQSRLLSRIRRKLPSQLVGAVGPEDVLQDVYIDVFRGIGGLEQTGERAFLRWLIQVTDHRLVDTIRTHQAAKRGGGWQAVTHAPGNSSIAPLIDIIHVDSQTPSQVFARDEVEAAVMVALAGLKEDYREVLRLRFIEGLSVADTASRMNRTEWSVHKLCSRGLEQLRKTMGELSRYLTKA